VLVAGQLYTITDYDKLSGIAEEGNENTNKDNSEERYFLRGSTPRETALVVYVYRAHSLDVLG
jgi:hypothetical protein